MPFTLDNTDHKPIFFEAELKIKDLDKLVQHVAFLMLGKHRHVGAILAAKHRTAPRTTDEMIDVAREQLSYKTQIERYKRDGWLFQLMTWVAIRIQYEKSGIILQIPHDNPAQHGIDGLGIILDSNNRVKSLIISEDKYTEHARQIITREVWPEFEDFDDGIRDRQLVARATGLLSGLNDDEIDTIINEDIYDIKNRIYRVGITPSPTCTTVTKRKKLFKGYNNCVSGKIQGRRQALTFAQPDIRKWMDDFSNKISIFLDTQRPA